MPENTRLVCGDVMDLPPELEPCSYDLVTILAVLEHLPDPAACLREAFRMLRPGGIVVASCPNPFWDEVAGHLKMVADEHHEQHLGGKELLSLANEAGFEDAVFEPFMWAPVGVLPYLKIAVNPDRALRIDRVLRRLSPLRFSFVNQGLVAQRPR